MTIKIHEMDNIKLSQSIELKHKLKHLETKAFYMQKKKNHQLFKNESLPILMHKHLEITIAQAYGEHKLFVIQ